MSMYNSIEYSDNYSKTSGNLWKYCRDEPNEKTFMIKLLEMIKGQMKISTEMLLVKEIIK